MGMSFDEWMEQFDQFMEQSGMPRPQIERYYREFNHDVRCYYEEGVSPGDAVTRELLP
jgi:hypothetical protein